jgi:hypothetical protein
MGPGIDIVGAWRKAVRDEGLRFGISEHLWITYKWYSTSHGSRQVRAPCRRPLRRRQSGVQGPLRGLGRHLAGRPAVERGQDPELVEAPLARADHGPDRPARAGPPLFGRLPPLRGIRVLGRLAPLQPERPAQRRAAEAVYFSKRDRDSELGPLRPRPRARRPRRHPCAAVADRHVHRRLALQARHALQDAEGGRSTCWSTS